MASSTKRNSVSTDTIFGCIRYLEKFTDRLYENGISYDTDISRLTKKEFEKAVGRTTKRNLEAAYERLNDLGISFRPSP
jgi:hypothetical protein